MPESLEQIQTYMRDWHWCTDTPVGLASYVQSLILDQARLQQSGTEIWNDNKKSVRVCTYAYGSGDEMRIAIKCNNDRRFMRYFFRPSQALKEYRGFQIVKSLGIPCVDVLGCGDFRFCGSLAQSYFVTRYEENTYQLLEYTKGAARQHEHDEMMRFLKITLNQMAKLHKAGYRHGGAHGRNFMCRKSADGKIELIWLDLTTVRPFSRCHRLRELLLDVSDLIEYFELSEAELLELQNLYNAQTGNNFRFEKMPSPQRKLNHCVVAD